MTREYGYRVLFFVVGLIVLAFGATLTIKGQAYGIGPWDVLHVGLYNQFGLTIGTWNIITGLFIVFIVSLSNKRFPKWGTWVNLLTIGIFIDFFNWVLPDVTSMMGKIFVLTIGTIIIALGSGIYVAPNLGAGPRDSFMLLLVDRFDFKIKNVRTAIEVIVALVGWALGGPVGVGTVLIALLIGQIMHITLPISQKALLKILGKEEASFMSD